MPLLVQFSALGVLREGLVAADTDRLAPMALIEGAAVPMSVGAAAVVLLFWANGPLFLGAWRTCTRDA